MADFKIDPSDFLRHLSVKQADMARKSMVGMQDAMDELLRVSRELAPIATGQLRRSGKNRVYISGRGIIGEVTYSAVENSSGYGRFNYALWTHEYMDESQAQTDGTGPKYLERPLREEGNRLLRIIADAVEEALD